MESSGKKSERLIQLELLLISHPEGMRRAEIARRLGVHRATVGRYIDELSGRIPIWEKDYRVGIESEQIQELTRMGLLESLTVYMALKGFADRFKTGNPQAASAVRKLAAFLKSYAPFISLRLNEIADQLDSTPESGSATSLHNLERLGEAWIAGKKVRLTEHHPVKTMKRICSIHSLSLAEDLIDVPPVEVIVREKGRSGFQTIPLSAIDTVEILLEDSDIDPETVPSRLRTASASSKGADGKCRIVVQDDEALPLLQRVARGKLLVHSVDGASVAEFAPISRELLFGAVFSSRGNLHIMQPQEFREAYGDLVARTREMLDGSGS